MLRIGQEIKMLRIGVKKNKILKENVLKKNPNQIKNKKDENIDSKQIILIKEDN